MMKNQIHINKLSLGFPALALVMSTEVFSQALPDRPNVLVIMTDQQTSGVLSGIMGNRYLNTPNMDDLAKHGVIFTNAYCANPLCIPSRSSLFTGCYPHELGIQENVNKTVNPADFPTLGTIFKNAGYETGYVGKWHLPYDVNDSNSHGFQYMANIRNNGVDSLLPASSIQFLERKREKPFLMIVSFVNPHNICEWARGEKLPDGEIGIPPSANECPPLRTNHLPSRNESDIMQTIRVSYQTGSKFPVDRFSDEKWRQYQWAYYRMIEKVDQEIGLILTSLRKSGLDNNTLIVFTSDHGDCQGAHGWNQKTVLFEESTKVPFIISFKNFKSAMNDNLVQTGVDLLPTLCDFAGIQLQRKSRGVSLKKNVLDGSISTERDYIVVSDKLVQGDSVNGYLPRPEGRMVRNNRYKYWIYNEGRQRESLYDLQKDPGEMVNVATDPQYMTELKKCRSELYLWADKYNDAFIKHLIK